MSYDPPRVYFIPQTENRDPNLDADYREAGQVLIHVSPFVLFVETVSPDRRECRVQWHAERNAWIEVAEVG